MCSYDDMMVSPVPQITNNIARTNIKLSRNSSSYNIRINIYKIFESTHLFLLLYLLISPVSGGPFILPGKKSLPTQIPLPVRHSHRGHPKVGIGIINSVSLGRELSSSQEAVFNNLPTGYQGLPLPSSSYNSHQIKSHKLAKLASSHHRSNLKAVIGGSTNLPLQSILSSLEDSNTQSLSFVPKSSSSPLLRVFEFSDPESPRLGRVEKISVEFSDSESPRLEVQSPRLAVEKISEVQHRLRHNQPQLLSMDEENPTSASSPGRERRATAPTPSGSGRGEWMKPCPNLDSELDENATQQSLSAFILRAIHEAKSQVDKFINDFARETFRSDSWERALPEFQDYSFPFLNNSGTVDLNTPEEISFPDALQEAYELMQRRAVGIEQVTLDQALYQANFLTEFRHVEDRIVHVLCELRHAMIQSTVTPKQEVTKDVMKEEARDIDGERWRNIRDAVILREYVTGLQVLHALFSYFAADPQ